MRNRKLSNILTAYRNILTCSNNSIYGIPNYDAVVFPKNNRTKTKAESKKCKTCIRFKTSRCYHSNTKPMSAVCPIYEPKRKK